MIFKQMLEFVCCTDFPFSISYLVFDDFIFLFWRRLGWDSRSILYSLKAAVIVSNETMKPELFFRSIVVSYLQIW